MVLLNNKWLMPIGCTCLAIAILADRFITGNGLVDFAVGVLAGMSIVLNLVALYRSRKS